MKNFTVTIAGLERYDGEEPYTYVVVATDAEEAWEQVYVEFVKDRWLPDETPDVKRVGVVEGVPARDCGYYWNDMRPVESGVLTVGHILEAIKGLGKNTPVSFDFLALDARPTKLVLAETHSSADGLVLVMNEEPDEEKSEIES